METTSTPRNDWSRYTTDADGTVITKRVQLIFETVGYEPDTFGTSQLKDDESFADMKQEISDAQPKHNHGTVPISTLKSLYTTWHLSKNAKRRASASTASAPKKGNSKSPGGGTSDSGRSNRFGDDEWVSTYLELGDEQKVEVQDLLDVTLWTQGFKDQGQAACSVKRASKKPRTENRSSFGSSEVVSGSGDGSPVSPCGPADVSSLGCTYYSALSPAVGGSLSKPVDEKQVLVVIDWPTTECQLLRWRCLLCGETKARCFTGAGKANPSALQQHARSDTHAANLATLRAKFARGKTLALGACDASADHTAVRLCLKCDPLAEMTLRPSESVPAAENGDATQAADASVVPGPRVYVCLSCGVEDTIRGVVEHANGTKHTATGALTRAFA
jgi:hypothetical protein